MFEGITVSGIALSGSRNLWIVAAGDALAKVLLNAIQTSRTLPREVRVRSHEGQPSPAHGVLRRHGSRGQQVPASDEARSSLLASFVEISAEDRMRASPT